MAPTPATLFLACAAACALSLTCSLETVDTLDATKYIGRWYQVSTDKFNSLFMPDGACITADYALNTDGTIAVVNSENLGDASGELSQITGYAYVVDAAEPGQLKVHLEGVPFDGDYWVLELGEEVEGYYQYSIVSDSRSQTLFVLARDVAAYYANYDEKVSASLEAMGFTKAYNSPVSVPQDNCTYAAEPNTVAVKKSKRAAPFSLFGVDVNPATTEELVVDQYLGRWYQMYASATVMKTFEKDAVCVTADYGVNSDGTLSVFNAENLGTAEGEYSTIEGYAYQPDAENEPGKLKVHFDTGAPFDAPYWVLALGPVNDASQYEWSVVSDPLEATLFILARDVATFRSTYEADVLALVENLGFTNFYNKPVETLQDGCTYYTQTA